MEQKELIKECRYFNGEEKNPFDDADRKYFWQAERTYVNHGGKAHEIDDSFYKALGGGDYPGVPHELLITLFSYWSTGTSDARAEFHFFKRFMENYLKEGHK